MRVFYPYLTLWKIFIDLSALFLIRLSIIGYFSAEADPFAPINLVILFTLMIVWLASARVMGLYRDYRITPFSVEWVAFLKTFIAYGFAGSTAVLLVLNDHGGMGRGSMLMQLILMLLVFPSLRVGIRVLVKKMSAKDAFIRKVLIIGTDVHALDFYHQYVKEENYGYKLAGFLDDDGDDRLTYGKLLGRTSDIHAVLEKHELDEIVVTGTISDDEVFEQIVSAGEQNGKRIRYIPAFAGLSGRKIELDSIGTTPVINLRSLPLDDSEHKGDKRIFDVFFCLFVIVFVLSWLYPIIALLIKIGSKGPVIFKQERWGLNNKSIVCYKFRTMVSSSSDVDDNGIYQQARKNDPRVTRIGAFLRKTNLDELPQFINVLLGSMSVVGPRPHPVPLNILSKGSIDNYMMRHWVKPGITGWAQVNGFRGETNDSRLMKKRVEFDIWYIENWNFWLDQQIIIQTLVNMVRGEKNAY